MFFYNIFKRSKVKEFALLHSVMTMATSLGESLRVK